MAIIIGNGGSTLGEGGGGFALGPSQNVFTGVDRTAAESARDVYAGANPLWLAEYNADINLNIRLEYTTTEPVVLYQVRNEAGTAWLDNSSAIGVKGDTGAAGATGNSYFFSSIAARDAFFGTPPNQTLLETDLPVTVNIGNDTTAEYLWVGATSPVSYDNNNWRVASKEVSSGTLFLGEGGASVSSGNDVLNFTNASTVKHYLHGIEYSDTGSITPTYWILDPLTTSTLADVFDTTLADPQDTLIVTALNDYFKGFTLIPATIGTLRVQTWLGTDDTGAVLVDSSYEVLIGDVDTETFYNLPNDILITVGESIFTRLSGVQLKGGLQTSGPFIGLTTPFSKVDIWNATEDTYLTGTMDTSVAQRTVTIDGGMSSSNGIVFNAISGGGADSSELTIDNDLVAARVTNDSGASHTGLDIDAIDGIRVFDAISGIGQFYHADYSVNGIAVKGDRWIPDKGYVDSVSATEGIDDVLAVGQALTANRSINGGNFTVDINSESLVSFSAVNGSNFNVFLAEDGVGSIIQSVDGAAQASITLDETSRAINFYSTSNSYILGDTAGGNLPPLNDASSDLILTVDPSNGVMGTFSNASVVRSSSGLTNNFILKGVGGNDVEKVTDDDVSGMFVDASNDILTIRSKAAATSRILLQNSWEAFLDNPTNKGLPRVLNSERQFTIRRFCTGVLPKPNPGSSIILSSGMPALTHAAILWVKKNFMSSSISA